MTITGINLPGRTFCRPDGSPMENVHVGVQLGREPAQLIPADSAQVSWVLDIDVVRKDGLIDFRGAAVHGARGERFIYLTWGDLGPTGHFEMFRRAKLMLHRVEPPMLELAERSGMLAATIDLTDRNGGPRCARVDPPALIWSVPTTSV